MTAAPESGLPVLAALVLTGLAGTLLAIALLWRSGRVVPAPWQYVRRRSWAEMMKPPPARPPARQGRRLHLPLLGDLHLRHR